MAGFSQTVFRRLPNLNLQWITRPPPSSCCRSQRLVHSSPRANPLSTQKEVPEGVINFSVGTPGKSLIPKKLVDEAMTDAIAQNDDPFLYQYAKVPGSLGFRKALAGLLDANGFTGAQPDNICATFGNSLALATIAKIFARPGQVAVVEEPNYFLSGKVFQDAGLRCVRIPVDEKGILVEDLEKWLNSTPVKPSLVYCIPRYHNPTGSCLDPAREERLIELAAEHSFKIVYDDPYSLLHYSPARQFPQTRISPHSISLGSFSKVLTPGLRLGWMLSGPETISRINTDGALCSGGGPANVITEAVRLLIERGGLESHMERVRSELGRRQEALAEAVHRHLGGLGKVTPVDGGYFAMVDLGLGGGGTMGGTAEGLRGYCEEVGAGVLFMPVNRCSVGGIAGCPVEPGEVGFGEVPVLGGLWSGKARLSVSYYEVEEIEEGVRRLGEAVEGYKKRLVGLGVGADGKA